MSVALHLTTEQTVVFKKVIKEAKIKNIVYFSGNPELDRSNFEKVVDAIQAAWFKVLKADETSTDAEHLRNIAGRLDKLWVFFESMPKVDLDDPEWTEIQPGTPLKEEIKKVDEKNDSTN